VLRASLYIAACSARNRIAVRLRRLREPRYLVGALLAAAYFVFIFVVPRQARRRGPGGGVRGFPPAALDRYGVLLGGVGLLLFSAIAWMFPSKSHLFAFTEAEVAFLFPAPVTRRQLLVHRLIRSQLGLLFAAMVPVFLVALPGATASMWQRLLFGISLWISFAATRVYFAGVTMARDRLGAVDPRARRTAWAPLLVTLAALAVVVGAIAREVPFPPASVPAALAQVGEATSSGWPRIVLMPFRLLLAPMFAEGTRQFVVAVPGALLVLAAAIAWVIKSDEVFHAVGARHEAAPASVRRGRGAAAPKLRWAGWSLPLAGRTEAVFFWKNGMATLRSANIKSFIPIAVLLVYAVVGARFGFATSLGPAICLAALMIAAFATLLGPGSVMSDFRGDLRHMELLKTWPVKGGALLRGEMLWPGLLVSGSAWLALTCALVFSQAAFPDVPPIWRLSVYGAAVLLVPAFVFAQYMVHQAAAVLFPAWVPTGNEMRGFESMAQRLLLFAGVALALFVMIGPGAIAGGIVAIAFYRLTGSSLVFVPAAAVCLVIVAVEVILASEALAPAYERIDLSGVERSE
jgi:hypothetical protein